MSRDKLTFAMKQEKSVAFQSSVRTEKTSPLLCVGVVARVVAAQK